MTSSVTSQVQYMQGNTFFAANSSNTSSKVASTNEGEDFSKVFSAKSEEQRVSNESNTDSKEVEETTEKESMKTDETKETKEIKTTEETEKSDDLKEEKIEELDTMIEDLICFLQSSNIIDVDKLQSMVEDFQNGDMNIDELKALIENLELNTNLNISNQLREKIVKVSELLESIEDLNLQEIPSQIATIIGANQANKESSVQFSNEDSSQLSNEGLTETDLEDDAIVQELNISTDTSKEVEIEAKVNQDSEASISIKSDIKSKDLFAVKKNTIDSSLLQKGEDMAGIVNIEAEAFGDYEIVNPSSSLTDVQKPDMSIFNQILEEANLNISEDTSEMIIKLKPDNLGKLSMKIAIDRGMVVARFDVESQVVKEAIESNLEDLRNALKDKGFEIQAFDVSVNKDSDQSENQFGYFNQGQRKKISINSDIAVNESYFSTGSNAYGGNSTIDYFG